MSHRGPSTVSSISNTSSQHASALQRETNRQLVEATRVERIVEIVERFAADFNAVNVSTAFHRLAKLWNSPATGPADAYQSQRADHTIRQLGDLALLHLRCIQGQGLGIVVWSLAKINYDASRVRHLLQAFAQEAVHRLNSAAHSSDTSLKLGAQSLSNMLYAYALLNHHPGTQLLSAIAKGVQWQLRDFSPQGLSNTVWSLAKLGTELNQDIAQLLEAISGEAVSQLRDVRARAKFIPQNLSNMLYGFAQLGVQPSPVLLEAVALEARRQILAFGPQELTNILWAMAKLTGGAPKGEEMQAFIACVPSAALQQLHDDSSVRKVKPQTLSNLLFAFAALDCHPGEVFLASLGLAIERQAQLFKPQELAASLWGFAMLRHHPGPGLVNVGLTETRRQLDKFKLQDLITVLFALAKLGSPVDASVAEAAAHAAGSRGITLQAADFVNLLWALAASNQLQSDTVAPLLASMGDLPVGSFDAAALRQLAMVRASLPDPGVFAQHVSQPLQQRIDQANQALPGADASKESICNEVSALLTVMEVQHSTGQDLAQGALTIDVFISSQQVAIQLDGPGQFFSNPPHLPLGDTLLEWRLLLSTGFKVVSVPFYAWQAAGSPQERRSYLEHLLSMGTSSLAFDKATGLAPLQAMQQQWQGGGGQQLATSSAIGGRDWQPGHSQSVRQGAGQPSLWRGNGELPAPALPPGLPPLAVSASRPLSQPIMRSHSAAGPDAGGSGGSEGMWAPRLASASSLGGGAGAGFPPSQPPPPPLPRAPSAGPPMPDPVPRVASVDGRLQWLGAASEPPFARQGQPPQLPPGFRTSSDGAAMQSRLQNMHAGLGDLHATASGGGVLQRADGSGSIATNSFNYGSLHTASGLSRFSSQSSMPAFGGSGALQHPGSARAMSSLYGQDSGRLLSGQIDEGELSERLASMSAMSSDSAPFRDGFLDPRQLLQHRSLSNGHSSHSSGGSALWASISEVPAAASGGTWPPPPPPPLPPGIPSVSPFVSARGNPPGAMSGRDLSGMRRVVSPALAGQRSYSGHTPHGINPSSTAQDPAMLRAASCSGPSAEPLSGPGAAPLRSHSALYPQQQAQQQLRGSRDGRKPGLKSTSFGDASLSTQSSSSNGSRTISYGGVAANSASTGVNSSSSDQTPVSDLRRLWAMVSKPDFGQAPPEGSDELQDQARIGKLKRVIESLPLETSAVTTAAPHLSSLSGAQFAALLKELASDNHAFRAWQLFDWVRGLPEDHALARLCDADSYTTMIALCGPWQQLRRALQLIADMRTQGIECGVQAYTALLGSAVKCGEAELAVDVYGQLRAQGFQLERHVFHVVLEVFLKLGRWQDALSVMDDMAAQGLTVEAQTYNLMIATCVKMGQPDSAMAIYQRMWKDGVAPTTKTFVSLITVVSKGGNDALDIVVQAIMSEAQSGKRSVTYSAAMAACEKAGQWELAVKLFDKVSELGVKAEVGIFNSIVAACAHSGEHAKARVMFETMPDHGCAPDAVTFANLIRAYKKGGQWCQTVSTLEAMQAAGAEPHAAVISSVIDALWHTGIVWAQAKAAVLFEDSIRAQRVPGATEIAKKGTLRVDLQALTVGVALLAMHRWLASMRAAVASGPGGAPTLDGNRKLAIINGMGDHSRAQGNSSAVKEAIGSALIGSKAPFRLMSDHVRCGRLEAATSSVREWLLSDAFHDYAAHYSTDASPEPAPLMPTEEYAALETAEAVKCEEMFEVVRKYEAFHANVWQVLTAEAPSYLSRHKQLVQAVLHAAGRIGLSDQVAHAAVALMDATVAAGGRPSDALEGLFIAACLRIAAASEGGRVPSPEEAAGLLGSNVAGGALTRMEADVTTVVRGDTACISALHVLKVYAQRLGCDLRSGRLVSRVMASSFLLVTAALCEGASLQWSPSLMAAAVLIAARRHQGCIPTWPTTLAALTGFNEATTPGFAAAVAHADRLAAHMFSGASHTVAAPLSI